MVNNMTESIASEEFEQKLKEITDNFIGLVQEIPQGEGDDLGWMIKLSYTIGLLQGLQWSAGYIDDIIGPDGIMDEIEKRMRETVEDSNE